jgi:hypothetical protein
VKSNVLDTTVSSVEMIHMMNDIASISTEVWNVYQKSDNRPSCKYLAKKII